MIILPAIDLYEGKAVRLLKGRYQDMTVYSDRPEEVSLDFEAQGARWIHLVDLEGAKSGKLDNLKTVASIIRTCGLSAEIGGGIRTMDAVDRYIQEAGASRVILGTAAVTDPEFLEAAVKKYGEKIAVGIDLKDGYAAIKGWTETSDLSAEVFFRRMEDLGVKNIICTDISKDGAMAGTNRQLYKDLSGAFSIDITASGGVSTMEDVLALKEMGLYGAIIGKAYYTKAIDLREAIEAAK